VERIKAFRQRLLIYVLIKAAYVAQANLDAFSWVVYVLARYVLRYRWKVVNNNLKRIAPWAGWSETKKTEVREGFYRHFANVIAETLAGLVMKSEMISEKVHLSGLSPVAAATVGGENSIILTSHLGNWEWLLLTNTKFAPLPIWGLYQPLSSKPIDRLLLDMRSKGGAKLVAHTKLLRILALREPDTPIGLAMVADQAPMPAQAYPVTFMGVETHFFKGVASLSKSLQAQVYFLDMAPGALPHTYTSNLHKLEGEGLEIIDSYVQHLERAILANPTLYLWSHNRFKHSPEK
jgi:Kdo2-lipid IVA lauroyltransferase/acyltransferase